MAATNLVRLANTTHTHINTIVSGQAQTGTNAGGYDENGSTYQGYIRYTTPGFTWQVVVVEAEHVFPRACTLSEIKYQFYVRGGAHQENGYAYSCGAAAYVEYQLEGSSTWTAVYSTYYADSQSIKTINVSTLTTYTATIENVKKVRCRLLARGYGSGGGAWGEGEAYLYELQAIGEPWVEALRIKKDSGTIVIGGRVASATDKLRIYKGTSVIGIPLVATNDAIASQIHVYDGTTIKALPLLG